LGWSHDGFGGAWRDQRVRAEHQQSGSSCRLRRSAGRRPGILIDAGGMTRLGTLGGLNSYAFGINAHAEIVGYIDTAEGARAFLYSGGGVTNLGTLGGTNSYAYGVNVLAQVAGASATDGQAGT